MALVRRSFAIDSELLECMESLIAKRGYKNRSEFIRDMIRDRLVSEYWAEDRAVLGTLTLVYDHETRQLGPKLTSLQHHHHNLVLASTHVHLSRRLCAEMIMVRGKGREIKALADRLHREKGVLHAKLATGTTGHSLHGRH